MKLKNKKNSGSFKKGHKVNLGKKLSEEHKRKISESNKGKTISDEIRKKISLANKGKKRSEEQKNKLKGRKFSEETLRKMSLARKGKKLSEKTKKKLSIINIGKRHSKETLIKLRETHLGQIPWCLGKNLSQEHRKKISIANTGKKHPHSEETKKKISEAQKGEKGNNWEKRGKNSNSYRNGLTPLYLQIRHCFKSQQFSYDCYIRDNYACQKCKERGGILCVHHIKSFSDIIEENNIKSLEEAEMCNELWDVRNGIVFCKEDHKVFHEIFGFRNNNKEQIEEFLKN